MNTLAYSSPAGHDSAFGARLRRQAGPLTAIVLAHAFFFYMVYSGLLHRIVRAAMPAEVVVTFVDLPTTATPPAAPKVAQLAPLTPPPVPQVPQIALAPPDTITVPSPPASAAPGAPAADKTPQPVVAASVAPPQPQPQPSLPRTLTTGVEYLQAPQPVYPQQSRRMGEQGKVVLRILVSAKGTADTVSIESSSGFSRLDDAARQAGMRTQFKPHLEDGRPVAVFVIVPLSFALDS